MPAIPITNLQTETITVVRQDTPGTYVDGEFVLGTTLDVEMIAVVLPYSGTESQLREYGRTKSDVVSIWTDDELFIAKEVEKIGADVFNYEGFNYQIMKVTRYGKAPFLSHYESEAVRVDVQGGS